MESVQEVGGDGEGPVERHHLWWLIAVLAFLAIFLIGVGVTSGIL
jgi:hypothetical protein